MCSNRHNAPIRDLWRSRSLSEGTSTPVGSAGARIDSILAGARLLGTGHQLAAVNRRGGAGRVVGDLGDGGRCVGGEESTLEWVDQKLCRMSDVELLTARFERRTIVMIPRAHDIPMAIVRIG